MLGCRGVCALTALDVALFLSTIFLFLQQVQCMALSSCSTHQTCTKPKISLHQQQILLLILMRLQRKDLLALRTVPFVYHFESCQKAVTSAKVTVHIYVCLDSLIGRRSTLIEASCISHICVLHEFDTCMFWQRSICDICIHIMYDAKTRSDREDSW